jgi:transcriptional regulator with XRE-family HTH domain
MIIGERLRELRRQKNFTHGDIQERTGLLRCYVSRVENGHTVPSIGTLEKMACALEVPLYRIFHDGEVPPLPGLKVDREAVKEEMAMVEKFRKVLGRASEYDRQLLLNIARSMAKANRRKGDEDAPRKRKRRAKS